MVDLPQQISLRSSSLISAPSKLLGRVCLVRLVVTIYLCISISGPFQADPVWNSGNFPNSCFFAAKLN